jgi:DNA-binding MarR family transcriptional regulator
MVTFSRMDLLAAQRLLQLLLVPDGQSPDAEGRNSAAPGAKDRALLVARARTEFLDRRRRVAIFGQSMFGEAAWDMLLALYILDMSGQRQTVGSLIDFAGTPATTAKRWLDFLMAHDFVRREPHPTDRRTAFVTLTSKARDKLDLYYAETGLTVV